MSFASPAITAARAPRRINTRLTRWWMLLNAAGATLLAARTLEVYAVAHANGYRAPSQTWASLAEWVALTIALGAAQPAACAWAFSRINIAQSTLRGTLEAFLGLLTGFLFPLLGMAIFRMPDAALGAWIFAPTGLVFGWLISSSQSALYPQLHAAANVATHPPPASTAGTKRPWRLKIRWKLTLWWMAVNTAALALAVALSGLYDVAHGYRTTHAFAALYLFLLLAVLGVLHAVAGSALISLVRIRNKAVRIALGVTLGLVTAILALILGTTFLWIYAVLAFWVFVPSGILFGCLCASPQPIVSSPIR